MMLKTAYCWLKNMGDAELQHVGECAFDQVSHPFNSSNFVTSCVSLYVVDVFVFHVYHIQTFVSCREDTLL